MNEPVDPILDELRRIRAEQYAANGNDIRRHMEESRRLQYLEGVDLYARSKSGCLEVVFRALRKPDGDPMRGEG